MAQKATNYPRCTTLNIGSTYQKQQMFALFRSSSQNKWFVSGFVSSDHRPPISRTKTTHRAGMGTKQLWESPFFPDVVPKPYVCSEGGPIHHSAQETRKVASMASCAPPKRGKPLTRISCHVPFDKNWQIQITNSAACFATQSCGWAFSTANLRFPNTVSRTLLSGLRIDETTTLARVGDGC